MHVAVAFDRQRLAFGARQRRQQQSGQNRDDGNDNQKFDQGESRLFLKSPVHRIAGHCTVQAELASPELQGSHSTFDAGS